MNHIATEITTRTPGVAWADSIVAEVVFFSASREARAFRIKFIRLGDIPWC